MFEKFLKGFISRKSEPFKDIKTESSHLMSNLKDFYPEESIQTIWHRRYKEVEYLKSGKLTFEVVQKVYTEMMLDKATRRMAIFRTYPEKLSHLAKNLELETQAKNNQL